MQWNIIKSIFQLEDEMCLQFWGNLQVDVITVVSNLVSSNRLVVV